MRYEVSIVAEREIELIASNQAEATEIASQLFPGWDIRCISAELSKKNIFAGEKNAYRLFEDPEPEPPVFDGFSDGPIGFNH